MWTEITSTSNRVYKHIKALNLKNYRDKNREYLIEGIRLVNDAMESNAPVKLIAVSEDFLKSAAAEAVMQSADKYGIRVYKMADRLFKELTNTETPQGIMGIVGAYDYNLEDIPISNPGFFVFCDHVQDPGNLGTIIRTADAAGSDGVILSKGCVDIYNPKVVRSTMGAIFHLPIIKISSSKEAILFLKRKGLKIISGYLGASDYHFDVDMKQGIAIVIGNEANGITSEVLSLSDYLVKIPIPGRAESLNAGIASGILMYEAVRQRIQK